MALAGEEVAKFLESSLFPVVMMSGSKLEV